MRDFSFFIDRGGTFTDVVASIRGGNSTRLRVTKVRVQWSGTVCPFTSPRSHTASLQLLAVDPANYSDAPTEGIRRILEQGAFVSLSVSRPLTLLRQKRGYRTHGACLWIPPGCWRSAWAPQ